MVRQTLERIAAPIRDFQKVAYLRLAMPIRGLHQAAYWLAALTLASQILALLRDRTFAHTFGAGHTLDLYYAAFRVPDLVFALVSSLVSAYVLIPLISERGREQIQQLLSESASFLLVAGGIICGFLAIFMPQFLSILYPDLINSPESASFVLLGRLLLVQPLLLGLSGVLGSVTQVHRRFVLFALSPVLYNVGIIIGTVFFYPHIGLIGIGWGVILGAVMYLIVNVPVLIEAGVVPSFRWPSATLIASVVQNSVPRSLALGMGAITTLILTSLASRVGIGSISVFTFATNLEAVPLSLIGASYAVAAFPALSEAAATKDTEAFGGVLRASARHIILWSFVAAGLVVVLRAHLVRVVLGTGAFDWDATRLTAALLAILVIGLVAQGLVLLFSRALYAARQSWRPLLYQLAGGAVSVLLALWFLSLSFNGFPSWLSAMLKVGDVPMSSILLVALAGTLGQIFLAFLSLFALRGVSPQLANTLSRSVFDGVVASLAGGIAAYATLVVLGGIAPLTTLLSVFLQGFVAGIAGLIASGSALFVIENKEFRIVLDALSKWIRPSSRKQPPIISVPNEESMQP